MTTPRSWPEPSDERLLAIEAAVVPTIRPVRPTPLFRVASAVTLGGAAVSLAAVEVMGPGLRMVDVPMLVVAAIATLTGVIVALRTTIPAGALHPVLGAAFMVLPFAIGMLGGEIRSATCIELPPHPFSQLECLPMTMGLAAIPFVTFLALSRRIFVTSTSRSAAQGALASAGIAALAVQFCCGCSDMAHLVCLHGGGIALLAALAALLGPSLCAATVKRATTSPAATP